MLPWVEEGKLELGFGRVANYVLVSRVVWPEEHVVCYFDYLSGLY